MRRRVTFSPLLLGISCMVGAVGVCSVPPSGAAQTFSARELPGNDIVKVTGPNALGQVAVRRGPGTGQSQRLLSTGDSTDLIENLGRLSGGDAITANGLNDAGDICGSANSRSNIRAVLWKKNQGGRDLGTLPGDTGSEGFAINAGEDVVGYSSGSRGVHAVLWPKGGNAQDLGTLPGGNYSKALGISPNGNYVVGSSNGPAGTHAILWERGQLRDLGTLPNDALSEAIAVNNAGRVVGYSVGPSGMRAFIWSAQEGMRALGSLPGGASSRALAIDNAGRVIGTSGSADGPRAVLWDKIGEPQDLTTLSPVPPGTVLMQAVGLNDRGDVVAVGRDRNDPHGTHEGPVRVFLLSSRGSR